MSEWHYQRGGSQAGPVSRDELMALMASGQVPRNVFVWRPGMPSWAPADTQPELKAAPPAISPPAAPEFSTDRPGELPPPGGPPPAPPGLGAPPGGGAPAGPPGAPRGPWSPPAGGAWGGPSYGSPPPGAMQERRPGQVTAAAVICLIVSGLTLLSLGVLFLMRDNADVQRAAEQAAAETLVPNVNLNLGVSAAIGLLLGVTGIAALRRAPIARVLVWGGLAGFLVAAWLGVALTILAGALLLSGPSTRWFERRSSDAARHF
jgi:hypothetical protein